MAQNSATSDTTGNDLTNDANPQAGEILPTARSSGEDKVNGNDMVGGDNRSDQETGTHPAFKSLDTKNNGYLTADDLKSHKWLSKNFARCDSDHDGQLDQKEYASCTK
jgi:Ca2+-binding EF-hand superfamily protein